MIFSNPICVPRRLLRLGTLGGIKVKSKLANFRVPFETNPFSMLDFFLDGPFP